MILKNDIRVLQLGSQKIYHDNGPLPRMIFDPEAIVGWEDTPDVKRDRTARPISHGDFVDRGYYEGKLITITGYAVANNPQELHIMRDTVAGLLQNGNEQWMNISNSAGTRYMKVSQGSRLSWTQMLDNAAKWKLDLFAADPRMYSTLQHGQSYASTIDMQGLSFGPNGTGLEYPLNFGPPTRPETATLSNNGNSEAWPTFKVYGDLPSGFSINNGAGRIVTYNGLSFKSMPVTIDMYHGTASVGGADRSYLLTRRDWFSIPPRGSIKPIYSPTVESSSWVDMEWRHTWV